MSNDTNTRDELARDIFDADNSHASEPERAWDDHLATFGAPNYAHNIADGLIAKGYRKPRIVTEVADLDALPAGAAILDSRNVVWVNDGDDYEQWASLAEQNKEGGPVWVSSVEVHLPATVLHEPEASL